MVATMAQRKSREFWSKVVEDFNAGDGRETHAEFAARRGLKKMTFQKWLYGIRKAAPRPVSRAVRLLPVHVVESASVDRTISVELGGGLGLRIAPGTDPAYVAALVTALRPC
jgi:hypothetical protein